jgi:hypothetical protein
MTKRKWAALRSCSGMSLTANPREVRPDDLRYGKKGETAKRLKSKAT